MPASSTLRLSNAAVTAIILGPIAALGLLVLRAQGSAAEMAVLPETPSADKIRQPLETR